MDRALPTTTDSERVSGITLYPDEPNSFDKESGRLEVPYEEPFEEDIDRDIEKAPSEEPPAKPTEEQKDPNLVVWDGPDDRENPMNWYDIQSYRM